MTLKIAPSLSLPMDFVTQTQAILAMRRRGKTYTASVQAEELLRAKQQIVVIDITGAWWGLKSSADGKEAGFEIVIAGGEHADIPLDPMAGRLLAEAITTDHFSCILDLKLLRKSERMKFLSEFLETFAAVNRQAVHLFADEADDYCPQQITWKEPNSSKCLGAMDDLVRRGGINGIGTTLITQRPAVLNNNVLTQCQLLTLLRLTHPADIKPIREWVKVHATDKEESDIIAALPTLGLGQAVLWSPGWPEDKPIGIKHIQIRERLTFNSSRTPKAGERVKAPKVLAKTDLDKLGQRIKEISERAKADDPKELRKKIAHLERELAAKSTVKTGAKAMDTAALERARESGFAEGVRQSSAAIRQHQKSIELLKQRITKAASILSVNGLSDKVELPAPPQLPAAKPVAAKIPETSAKHARNYAGSDTPEINKTQQRILDALAWYESLGQYAPSIIQVGAVALIDPTGGHFSNTVGPLSSGGLVERGDGTLKLTDAGRALANPVESVGTLAEYHDVLRARVRKMKSANGKTIEILNVVIEAAGGELSTEEIGRAVGVDHTGGHFSNSIGPLGTAGFIKRNKGIVTPTLVLFPEALA